VELQKITWASKLQRVYIRVTRFLRPTFGWKKKLDAYKKGQTTWSIVILQGENYSTGPWPLEWTPAAVEFERKPEDTKITVKLRFSSFFSDVSGRWAEGEDAVACARCGVHMHVKDTSMADNLDIPLCPWCEKIV